MATIVYTYSYREQTVDDKKKPEMLEKIIAGKVNKRMADLCLVSQVSRLIEHVALCMHSGYTSVLFV